MIVRMLVLVLVAASVFAADDAAQEARFLGNVRQLIYEGKRSGEGYFHPDGNRIVFQSEREEGNPFYQIYTLDLESGESRRVSPGVGKTTCAFFQPGTQRLIFASTHEDADAVAKQKAELEFRASGKQRRYSWDYDATMDIYSANADGSDVVNLTKAPGYDAEGSFSPDGKQIVFCSLRAAFPLEKLTPEQRARYDKDPAYWGDIYVMNADGSNVRRLTEAPGYDGGPFFSPDGKRIVWRHFDESGMIADVWTMDSGGGDKRRITDFKCMSWAPIFHPGGKYLIFTSNKLGFENFELFLVDVEGEREPVRVTFTPGFDGLPVFSPDGKKLCWASGRTGDGKSQIFMADWNHEEATKAIAEAPKRASVATSPANPPLNPEISADDMKFEVGYLADDRHAGRATGSDGARLASEWLGDFFKKSGLKPLPGQEGYFLSFDFNAGERLLPDRNSLVVNGTSFPVDKDFRPLAFTDNGEVEGEVIFAGYGLSVPEGTGQQRYISYDGLDVKDKIVLLLRYVPEDAEPPRRAHLNRYGGLRYKVMMARERGAKAVLVVTGPNSPNAGEVLPLNGDGTSAGSGLPAASISSAVADALLAPSGKKLKDLQKALDNENPHAEGGFALPGVKVKLATGVEHIKRSDRNVVGCIPGETDEWVIVGAHYDHLGLGKGNSSLARAGEEGKIHHGADDNASGTAAVIEIAAALAAREPQKGDPGVANTYTGSVTIEGAKLELNGSDAKAGKPKGVQDAEVAHLTAKKWKPKRGIVFALWSGEEIGLIGSNSFIEKPPVDLAKVVAYINFDMVGRLNDNKLTMQAVGSSKAWMRLLEKRNVAAGFQLGVQEDPYLPTDVTSFYPKRIPVLNFFTGSHEDYHRPTDTADKINYEGLERVAKFAEGIVRDVAMAPERPDFSRVERKEQGGGRDSMRAYLGSIPDYATEVKGVKLSGVRGGSPAEKGGLKGGDVIVEFGGQKIANIYDYTYALDAVKIGQPVKMIVEREGKRVELTVTPEARK